MECPKCKAELPETTGSDEKREKRSQPGAVTPDEALRADTPPAPCPQCGWSTMWNE